MSLRYRLIMEMHFERDETEDLAVREKLRDLFADDVVSTLKQQGLTVLGLRFQPLALEDMDSEECEAI